MKTVWALVISVFAIGAVLGVAVELRKKESRIKMMNLISSTLGSVRHYTIELFQKKSTTEVVSVNEEIPVSA